MNIDKPTSPDGREVDITCMRDTADNQRFLRFEYWLSGHVSQVACCIAAFGFFTYVYYATGYYLNPDEANYFVCLAAQVLPDTHLLIAPQAPTASSLPGF